MTYYGDHELAAPYLKVDFLSHCDIRERFAEIGHSGLDGCEHIGHGDKRCRRDVES
jgi:hypothetical protein